jgi:hypothetical protein
MPTNRFETSETVGAFRNLKLYGGAGRGKDVELTPDFSTIWVNTQDPVLRNENFLTTGLDFGIFERLDIGIQYVSDLGILLKAKWMIVGKFFTLGFQIATSVHSGAGGEDKDEGENTPTRANLDYTSAGADIIFGYRFNKTILLYTSAFHDDYEYEVEHTRGTVKKNFKGGSTNTGGTIGASFLFADKVEFARAKGKSARSNLTSSAYGAMVNLHFK